MKIIFLFITALLLISSQACKPARDKDVLAKDASVNFETTSKAMDKQGNESDVTESNIDRKLKKEASISFETREYKKTCSNIRNLITKYKGKIVKESDNIGENKEIVGNFDIRIPAKSFDLFLGEMDAIDGKIVNKAIDIEDITADYIDLETRLKSKKELENRYLQLLSKATKVSEILEIEAKLNDQRTEIESMEGRFRFMQHEVANNLLHITVNETKAVTSGFIGKLLKSLRFGWTAFVEFLIVILTLWPFMILGCIIWFFIRRYNQKKKSGKDFAKEMAAFNELHQNKP